MKKKDFSTKREVVDTHVAVKVTWWDGRRWWTTYEVQPKASA